MDRKVFQIFYMCNKNVTLDLAQHTYIHNRQ